MLARQLGWMCLKAVPKRCGIKGQLLFKHIGGPQDKDLSMQPWNAYHHFQFCEELSKCICDLFLRRGHKDAFLAFLNPCISV